MFQSILDRVKLNNAVEMPILGYGVFKIDSNDETAQCVRTAVQAGYRSIDTAMIYGNEEGVGKGIKECGVKREELFITTKVWNKDQGYQKTIEAFELSLKNMKLDYLDLYLIHWPVPMKGLYIETWRALEKLYQQGKVRSIGVSNFNISHLQILISQCEIVPVVNQVELHPWLNQTELRAFMKGKGIYAEAWSPLAQGTNMDNDILNGIAKKHSKTVAQVILRWHIQNRIIVIPKSTKAERIASNADIFNFELSLEELKKIDSLNCNGRIGPEPDAFAAE